MGLDEALAVRTVHLPEVEGTHVASEFASFLQPLGLRDSSDCGVALPRPMEAVALRAFRKDGCLILRLYLDARVTLAIDDLDSTTAKIVLGLEGIEAAERKFSTCGDTASEGYDVLGRVAFPRSTTSYRYD